MARNKNFDLTLDQLILNLKEIQKNGISICEKEIKYIYYLILEKIAMSTAYDTNQARASIAKLFFDKFGFDTSSIQGEVYNYWENYDRSFDNTSMSNMSVSDNNKNKFNVNISISDPAVVAMEEGNFELSKSHPRSDTGLVTMPISFVVDSVNHQDFNSVEGLTETLESILDKYIEMVVKAK